MHTHPRGDQERYSRQLERELRQAREQPLLSSVFEEEALAPPGQLDLNLSSSPGSSVTMKPEPAAPKKEFGEQPKEEPVEQIKQEPGDHPDQVGAVLQHDQIKQEAGDHPDDVGPDARPGPSLKRRRSQPERFGAKERWFDLNSSSDDPTPSKKPRLEFPCDLCEKVFPFESKLRRHVANVHTGTRVRCPYPSCGTVVLPESLEAHWKNLHHLSGFASVAASFSVCGACGVIKQQGCDCVGGKKLELEELVSRLASALDIPFTW